MRISKIVLLLIILPIISCGGGIFNGPAFNSPESVNKLINSLNERFTKDGGYMQITITYNEQDGNTIIAQATQDISMNKLQEWVYAKGIWEQKSVITMEIPEGSIPSDFMFQLKDINISNLPEMVNKAKQKVAEDKGLNELVCTSVSFTMSDRRSFENKIEDIVQTITIAPSSGGTNFNCYFDINGEIKEISY